MAQEEELLERLHQQQQKPLSASFTACFALGWLRQLTSMEAQQVGGLELIEELNLCGLQAARQQVQEVKASCCLNQGEELIGGAVGE